MLGRILSKLKMGKQGDVTSTLLRGAGSALVANAAGAVFILVAHVLLSRCLGTKQYGIFSHVHAWIAILSLIATCGLNTCLLRFVPQYGTTKDWKLFHGVLRRGSQIALLGGLVLAGVLVGTVAILFDRIGSDYSWTYWMAAATLPGLALAAINQAGLRGLKQIFRSLVPLMILRPILLLVGVVVVSYWLKIPFSAAGAMGLYTAAVLVSAVVGRIWLRQAIPSEVQRATPVYATAEWLRVSAPLLLTSGMQIVLSNLDVILIGILLEKADVAVYAAATRLVRLMAFGLRSGNMIAAPMISELYTANRHRELQRTTYVASWVSTVACLVIGGTLIGCRTFALGLFGEDFHAGANVLLILAVGQCVNSLTGPVGCLLNMTGKQDVNAKVSVVITGLNAALNYPAILFWGIEGAAVVTSGLLALKNLWNWWEVRQRLGINSSVFRIAIAAKS